MATLPRPPAPPHPIHASKHPPTMKRKVIDLGSSSDSSDSSPPKGYKNISPTNAIEIPATPNRQLASRRGHLKSRLGCFNCKRRRVKCNELRPSCSSCSRLGLSCVYPTSPTASGSIRANPSVLSLEDLRFYHRFLTTAFPTLPLGDDKVWAHCTAMSHQSECLAHAVLGLGASHLSEHGNTDYTAQALSHRVTAIKLVNEQFVNPPKDPDMKDAMFAAVFCLAAQTTLLPDGMGEYLTITRAGTLIWAYIMPGHDDSIFKAFTTDNHARALEGIVSEEPKDFEIVDAFLASVTKLRPLCEKPCEIQYLDQAVRCVDDLKTSSLQAWKSHADLWRLHCFFSNEDFAAFANPDNFVAQLLIMHMLLLDYVLGPFCVPDTKQFRFPARKRVIISWARQLLDRLPDSMKPYGDWIKEYCNTLEHSPGNYLLSP